MLHLRFAPDLGDGSADVPSTVWVDAVYAEIEAGTLTPEG